MAESSSISPGTRQTTYSEPATIRFSRVPAWHIFDLSGIDLMRRLLSKRRRETLRHIAIVSAVGVETLLLLVALVPASEWGRLGEPADPIPAALAPLVAALFYLLPGVIGASCRVWQLAIVLATLPVWLDLGIFAVAASEQTGPFYLVQAANSGGVASTFELFAALGLFGWLAATFLLGARGWHPLKSLKPSWPIIDRSYRPGRAHSDEE
jgi:hypothetical protein